MELTHNFTVPVAPEVAFEVLQDIERIGPCMPGATIDSVDGDAFTGTVKVKIGPIKVTYKGEAEYADVDRDALTATINARGKESRGSGTATAVVKAHITPAAEGAEVNVVTDLAVTGKPAQFGRGVMEEVGQKLINTFAECLATRLAEDVDTSGAATTAKAADAAGSSGDDKAVSMSSGGSSSAAKSGSDSTTVGGKPTTNGTSASVTGGSSATSTDDAAKAAGSADGEKAVSMSSGGSSSAAQAGSSATTSGGKPASTTRDGAGAGGAEAIDLLDVAGAPIAKRAAPLLGGMLLLVIIWWLKGRGDDE